MADQLLAANVATREVTSVLDIHGYRLYRRRYYGMAYAWFAQAAQIDPRFELSLFNAARTAALLGNLDHVHKHVTGLRALRTPLARSRLRIVQHHRDFLQYRTYRTDRLNR